MTTDESSQKLRAVWLVKVKNVSVYMLKKIKLVCDCVTWEQLIEDDEFLCFTESKTRFGQNLENDITEK